MERWKINLYTVWASQILSIMSFNFGIPFLPFYIQDLGVVAPDQIKLYSGLLSTAPAVTMAVMAPIWGIAADRWGKKLMLLRAMLCASLIIAGMGLVTGVNQLLVLRLIQGVFTGTVTASAALVASSTPTHRLSFAMGFMSSSTFIGASAGPVIGGFLADTIGYRPSFWMGGALMLLDFFLVLFLVKEEKTVPVVAEEREKKPSLRFFLASFMLSMLFILLTIRVSRAVFSPYLPLYVQELYGGTRGVARITGVVNGVTGLMTALAGLTLSRLGDRYNKMMLLKVLFLLGLGTSILLPAVSWNLWIFTAVYGIFFFLMGGVEPVIISLTTERTPAERRGVLFGIQGTVGNLGWAISPMLGGYISLHYSLTAILVLIPLALIPGLICMLFLTRTHTAPANDEEHAQLPQ